MGELTFKGLKVDELDLTNKIEGQVELDISQRASLKGLGVTTPFIYQKGAEIYSRILC